MIIIITNKEDICADFVVRELHEKGLPFWRFNTEDAPQYSVTFTPEQGLHVLFPDGKTLQLDDTLTGIWYRRPGWVSEAGPYGGVAEFVNDQWRQLIFGLTATGAGLWVNDPYANQRAECKPIQLQLAHSVGLPLPETCITNDVAALSAFRTRHANGAIVKAVYAPLIEDEDVFIFTHLLTDKDETQISELSLAPIICQQALLPKRDLRVTAVGQKLFTAELRTVPGSPVDWRLLPHEGDWVAAELPLHIEAKLMKLMGLLGLRFAGIDLIHYDEEYYFIEVNPNGEWGWLQTRARLPIAEALADLLTGGKA